MSIFLSSRYWSEDRWEAMAEEGFIWIQGWVGGPLPLCHDDEEY